MWRLVPCSTPTGLAPRCLPRCPVRVARARFARARCTRASTSMVAVFTSLLATLQGVYDTRNRDDQLFLERRQTCSDVRVASGPFDYAAFERTNWERVIYDALLLHGAIK